ncbi:MAG: hypothetical protein Q7K71_05635 [Candidatus Omnitrophota bacterium]|nr:hypothetical protein [Candidatus Omnitrophota bacterium]
MSPKTVIQEVEDFFGKQLPFDLRDRYSNKEILLKADQKKMMTVLAFTPPFLRANKIIIFKSDNSRPECTSSIVVGSISRQDTKGHYNETIYLALAGLLMPSSGTVHVAFQYPEFTPQAVEAEHVFLANGALNNGLIQPRKEGTTFYAETRIIKKKLQLVFGTTKIFFGVSAFGEITSVKFYLTNKDLIWKAVEVPEVG